MQLRVSLLASFLCCALFFVACSGNSNTKGTLVDGQPSSPPYQDGLDSARLANLEVAHESFLRALQLEAKGESSLAELFMRHAWEADRNNRFLAFSLVEFMEARGASTEALKLADTAKTLPGKQTSSQYALLARLYSQNVNLDSSKFYYKKSVEASDQNLRAAYEYALLLEVIRDYDELMRIYGIMLPQINFPRSMVDRQLLLLEKAGKDSMAIDLLTSAYDAIQDPEYRVSRTKLLIKQGRYEESLSSVHEMFAENPNDSMALKFQTAALVQMKKIPEALDSLKSFYRRAPKTTFVLHDIALMESDLLKKDSAKVHWNLLKNDPEYGAVANYWLSVYAVEEGDSVTSVKAMEKAYALAPDEYGPALVWRYGLTGRYAKAYPILDSLLNVRARVDSIAKLNLQKNNADFDGIKKIQRIALRQHADFQALYGNILLFNAEALGLKAYDSLRADSIQRIRVQANEHFRIALDMGVQDPEMLFSMGANLLALNKVDEAIAIFKQLFQKKPRQAMALNHLGYSLVDLNRNEKEVKWAASLIDSALAMDPHNVAFLDSKGWALYRLGDYEKALQVMNVVEAHAAEIEGMTTKDPTLYEHLAAICDALKLNDRALGYYKKILVMVPNHPQAKARIKALTSSSPAH